MKIKNLMGKSLKQKSHLILAAALLATGFWSTTGIALPAENKRLDHDEMLGETEHPEGKAVYESLCTHCHDAGVPKAPSRGMLKFMAPSAIYHALTEGVMQQQTAHLSDQQKRDVVEYLTGKKVGSEQAQASLLMCGLGT